LPKGFIILFYIFYVCFISVVIVIVRLHQMHEMQTIVTDVCGVSLSASLSVCLSVMRLHFCRLHCAGSFWCSIAKSLWPLVNIRNLWMWALVCCVVIGAD